MKCRWLMQFTAGMAFFLMFSGWSQAALLEVGPGKPYTTIQSAINDANDLDTVLVYPSTYNETISMDGKDITLTSTNPEDPNVVEATVIDAGGSSGVRRE